MLCHALWCMYCKNEVPSSSYTRSSSRVVSYFFGFLHLSLVFISSFLVSFVVRSSPLLLIGVSCVSPPKNRDGDGQQPTTKKTTTNSKFQLFLQPYQPPCVVQWYMVVRKRVGKPPPQGPAEEMDRSIAA